MSACEASWLPALRDGEKEVTAGLGQSSRRGKHVLPENHTLLEKGPSQLKPGASEEHTRGRRLHDLPNILWERSSAVTGV